MIKVLTSEQIRLADQATILHEPVSSLALMERAASACTAFILQQVPAGWPISIVCGKGNNGGDGLAIARQLWKRGKDITVWITEDTGNPSAGFSENLQRLLQETSITPQSTHQQPVAQFEPGTLIIDAIFGSGLNRQPQGSAQEMIEAINRSGCMVLSIDIPSGLFADQDTDIKAPVIRAHTTLVFQSPRPVFLYAEYEPYIGRFEVIDIGLDPTSLANAPAFGFIPDENSIQALLPFRPQSGHKGTFGHTLLLAGSKGKAGAAVLAARAALRSGAAMVTVRAPECAVIPLQTAVPEAMVMADPGTEYLEEPVQTSRFTGIAIGPGIGREKETGNVLKRLIQDADSPLVIDADALNLLADNPTWLGFLPAGSILTPHPGEFARLVGKTASPFSRTQLQCEFAKRYNCFLVLKGRFTAIACPDGQLFFNPTGNNGMAKAGSGDVLTGILGGLLAQGLSPMKAALLGVYLHGLAGDLCKEDHSAYAMQSGDIVKYLAAAYRQLEQ